MSRTTDLKDSREVTAFRHFLEAAVEYLQWSRRQDAPKANAAAHELHPVLGPSVAQDLQLVGFTPLEQGQNGAGNPLSSDEVRRVEHMYVFC